MIDFPTAFLTWFAATFIPALVGLTLIISANRFVPARYLAAFAVGIFLWFFVDTIGGAANLQVNQGFTGGIGQVAVVVLFILGVLVLFALDRHRDVFSSEPIVQQFGIVIPVLVAIAVGIHGLGEGTAFGGTASTTPSTQLLDAFGGVSAGIAYALHKMLEPMMIGACYAAYSRGRQGLTRGRLIRDIFILGIIFVIPSLLGAATGYYIVYDASYFFALGTGTSIYALIRLAKVLFVPVTDKMKIAMDTMKIAVAIVLGFIAIYIAALFHS
jgi:hypothetical protein